MGKKIIMRPELSITLPKTGLCITAPEQTARNMEIARTTNDKKVVKGLIIWSDDEKTRLKLLKNNTIFKKRYPSVVEGRSFMLNVDYEKQKELYAYAEDLSSFIVESWDEINDQTPIATVLFGSVACGLVKKITHPDPSNIDLAVIGNITEDERVMLFEAIRGKRKEIQQKIIQSYGRSMGNAGEGNAGVFIQHTEKLRNNNYQCAKEYIASNATTLHDPALIWHTLEQEALRSCQNKKSNIAVTLHEGEDCFIEK